MHGDIAKVEALLNGTTQVDVNWWGGTTALVTAADFHQVEIARLLLQKDADLNLANEEGLSPLLSAAHSGNVEMVRLLLNAGANPNTSETRHGFSPLTFAAAKGYTEIVKSLLDAGADRSAKVKDGRDAAGLAWHSRHMETLRVLTTYMSRTLRQTQLTDLRNSIES